MILVAITGTICSGKSFVSKIIADLGYAVFSCDDEIHEILKQKNILKKIKQIFPQAVIETGIDKKILADIIFEVREKRENLEKILYPELFVRENNFVQKHKKKQSKVLFFEVPLLYEKDLQDKYNFVIVTHAPKDILIKRACNRGLNQKFFDNILASQFSSEEKISKADYIIDTTLSKSEIRTKIIDIIKDFSFHITRFT